MSASKELEELQNKRAQLEEESHLLQEKEKTMEERVKILEQKIAIQELEDHNETVLKAVHELESKIGDLEKRLMKPTEEPETLPPAEEPKPEVTEPVQEEEPAEGEVEVRAIEEPEMTPQAEPFEEDQRRQHEKKRRRIF